MSHGGTSLAVGQEWLVKVLIVSTNQCTRTDKHEDHWDATGEKDEQHRLFVNVCPGLEADKDDEAPLSIISVNTTGHEYAQTETTVWSDHTVTRRFRVRRTMYTPWGDWSDVGHDTD